MTALGDDTAGPGAVVRNPPKNEPAGSEARPLARALWRFDWSEDGRQASGSAAGVIELSAEARSAFFYD